MAEGCSSSSRLQMAGRNNMNKIKIDGMKSILTKVAGWNANARL